MFRGWFGYGIIACGIYVCCQAQEAKGQVLVSLVPYQFLVEQIAGQTVEVGLVVPQGADPHFYEPTPQQMTRLFRADVWFYIGERLERRILSVMQKVRPELERVDLREGLPLIADSAYDNGVDPHIWLSAPLLQRQIFKITRVLSRIYPQHRTVYEEKARVLVGKLIHLDQQIIEMLKPWSGSIVMVSHPALTYFCRDYGLHQIGIEHEGKPPTPRRLTKLLEMARRKKISTLFVHARCSQKGVGLLAKLLGARLVFLDPLAKDCIRNLWVIAESIVTQGEPVSGSDQ